MGTYSRLLAQHGLRFRSIGHCSKLRSWWGLCVTCEPDSIRDIVRSQTGSLSLIPWPSACLCLELPAEIPTPLRSTFSFFQASYIGFSQGYCLCLFDLQFRLKSVVFAKNFGSASALYLQPELLKKTFNQQTIDLHYL
jgi:hypothetical protein